MMKLDFYNIMYLIIHLFDIFIVHKLYTVFLGKKIKNIHCYVLAFGFYYVITSSAYILFDIPVLNLVSNIVSLFLIAMNFKNDFKKILLSFVFVNLSIFVGETLICAITGYYNADFLERGSYRNYWGMILIRLFTYIEAIVISNFKDIKKGVSISMKNWLVTFFVPIATLFMEFNFLVSGNVTMINACISITIVLLLNFVCINMYNSLAAAYQDKMNAALFEQQKDYYMNQCELMQESSEKLRAFRHDMKNQLYVVKQLCDEGMSSQASAQLKQFVEEIDTSRLYSNSGNLIFDSILNYKLQNADVKGIDVSLEVVVPEQLEMQVNDIVAILGNLLDNALRALSESEDENKKLWVKIRYDRGSLILIIKNTYSGNIEYQNGAIKTTKTDKEIHGYGLSNVKKAVEKYEGYMEVTHENNIFGVEIILYCS